MKIIKRGDKCHLIKPHNKMPFKDFLNVVSRLRKNFDHTLTHGIYSGGQPIWEYHADAREVQRVLFTWGIDSEIHSF